MKNGKLQARDPAADILRCIAAFSVISIHFFMNSGFYSAPIDCPRMIVLLFMRSASVICVPLFLTLSGYLMTNKRPVRSYYRGIRNTLFTYVVSGLCCMLLFPVLYRWLQPALGLPDEAIPSYDWKGIVFKLLNFSAAPYAWYIEMYIGLFLLMPFLNILYHGIDSKRKKQALLLTLAVVVNLSTVVNAYNFTLPGWWSRPSMSSDYQRLIPDYWIGFYPVFYYFLGSYFREYGVKMKPWQAALGFAAACLISGSYNLWRSCGTSFVYEAWTLWASALIIPQIIFLTAFFTNLRYSRMPYSLRWCFYKLSGLGLGIYLTSWIFDNLYYPVLTASVPAVRDRLEAYFWIVPLVFTSSAVLSYGIQKLYRLWSLLIAALGRRFRRAAEH